MKDNCFLNIESQLLDIVSKCEKQAVILSAYSFNGMSDILMFL